MAATSAASAASKPGRMRAKSCGSGKCSGLMTLLTIGIEIWNRKPSGKIPFSRSVRKTK